MCAGSLVTDGALLCPGSKPKLMEGKEMISIFKEAKGGEVEGGKRDGGEDASQNKAHDASTSSPEANGDADKAVAAGKSVEAATTEGSAEAGGDGGAASSGAAQGSNGASNGAPKKMSYAQMANASKAAPPAVST